MPNFAASRRPVGRIKELGPIEACHHVPVRFEAQSLVEPPGLTVSDEEHSPDWQGGQQFIHELGPDTAPLVIRMNRDVVNRSVIFAVAQSAGGPYESRTVLGKTHDCAVLEGSLDFVTLASSQVCGLE